MPGNRKPNQCMSDSRFVPSQWETSLLGNSPAMAARRHDQSECECEQPNIFLYLESTIWRYGKFHNRCWGKTISWNAETYSPLIIDKTKKWSRPGRFFAKLTCLHGDSGRRKPVKTKTHISTTATTKYSEKSNITLMNIILGSGLSQTCILYDT